MRWPPAISGRSPCGSGSGRRCPDGRMGEHHHTENTRDAHPHASVPSPPARPARPGLSAFVAVVLSALFGVAGLVVDGGAKSAARAEAEAVASHAARAAMNASAFARATGSTLDVGATITCRRPAGAGRPWLHHRAGHHHRRRGARHHDDEREDGVPEHGRHQRSCPRRARRPPSSNAGPAASRRLAAIRSTASVMSAGEGRGVHPHEAAVVGAEVGPAVPGRPSPAPRSGRAGCRGRARCSRAGPGRCRAPAGGARAGQQVVHEAAERVLVRGHLDHHRVHQACPWRSATWRVRDRGHLAVDWLASGGDVESRRRRCPGRRARLLNAGRFSPCRLRTPRPRSGRREGQHRLRSLPGSTSGAWISSTTSRTQCSRQRRATASSLGGVHRPVRVVQGAGR